MTQALDLPLHDDVIAKNQILAKQPHRSKYYRFHKRCPKIKSPPYNSVICANCKLEIKKTEQEQNMVVSNENQQKYHTWCMLPESVFKARLREAESNAYYDHSEHIETIYNVDWHKMIKRKQFHDLLERCGCKAAALKQVILPFYEKFLDTYDMYGGFGRFNKSDPDDAFELQKNEVKQWATDSKIMNSTEVTWNRLFTFFLAANVELDAEILESDINRSLSKTPNGSSSKEMASKEIIEIDGNDEENDDTSLVRFEFLLFIILCAHARYYTQSSNDLVSAVEKCLSNHLKKIKLGSHYENLPQMDPNENHPCIHRPNDFRYNCLYRYSVIKVLVDNNKFLQSLFVYYSRHNGRKNELPIVYWFELIRDTMIIDSDSSERDILLCFCYSRMRVVDEMLDRQRGM